MSIKKTRYFAVTKDHLRRVKIPLFFDAFQMSHIETAFAFALMQPGMGFQEQSLSLDHKRTQKTENKNQGFEL
ncbi:MAG: hypothetical protein H7328_09155 [Bdellovibrio sp.]|nr:hypothetical protein [Bdellovibrio sp.]